MAFTVEPADIEEYAAGEPHSVAELNALRKAQAVARAGAIVLGVDTVVALDDRIFGKPRDAPQARATLRRLGGRTHEVVSGVTVIEDAGEPRTATAVTKVTFRELDDAWLTWYVGTEEWRGRAGGYAVQGAGQALVTRIDGRALQRRRTAGRAPACAPARSAGCPEGCRRRPVSSKGCEGRTTPP